MFSLPPLHPLSHDFCSGLARQPGGPRAARRRPSPRVALCRSALAALAGLAVALAAVGGVEGKVMNAGGVPYAISNGRPGASPPYSTDFEHNAGGSAGARTEHFDVYGEVRTRYSQVYWTRNAPIDLPANLVARFQNRTMAITGYEIDQVTHTGPQPGSTTSKDGSVLGGFSCFPDCEETDASVPIYHAYNHHYFSWLTGDGAVLRRRKAPTKLPNPTWTSFVDAPGRPADLPPSNIVFKENPGGEFRKSYHGYPAGYAQLIHSPNQWVVEPMQIDTHNRNYKINDVEGYRPWFLPRRDTENATMTNLHGGLSPLIECPCSDRISRSVVNTSEILADGVSTCGASIATLAQCKAQAAATGARILSAKTVRTGPVGCSITPAGKKGPSGYGYDVTFNAAKSSAAACGDSSSDNALATGAQSLGNLTTLAVSHDGTTATVTFSGPAGVWFGVGFDASEMADLPYAIIVDGSGKVTERKLGSHAPGALLTASITVVSSTVSGNLRTVTMTRPVAAASEDHYAIPTAPGKIDLITAVGNGPALAYHKARTGSSITLLPTASAACLCAPTQKTYLTYMNKTTAEFHYDCLDAPRSDMRSHGDGTGRNVENRACKMQTYGGGLRCCAHTYFLTDVGQDSRIPPDTDVYFLKWRYYFQEYVPASASSTVNAAVAAAASHKQLLHWVFLIDATVNDYEEDNAHYGEHSIGRISANLTVAHMGCPDIQNICPKISPIVMTPHCHAPSCLREELWNSDTGELICNVSVMYGHGSGLFDESDYVAIPPCLWGDGKQGLLAPLTLDPATNITAVKYFNNTFRHFGQMAQWTGLYVLP
jgi:hypothetical protein